MPDPEVAILKHEKDCGKYCKDHPAITEFKSNTEKVEDRHELMLDDLYAIHKDTNLNVAEVMGGFKIFTRVAFGLVALFIIVAGGGWGHSMIVDKDLGDYKEANAGLITEGTKHINEHKGRMEKSVDEHHEFEGSIQLLKDKDLHLHTELREHLWRDHRVKPSKP